MPDGILDTYAGLMTKHGFVPANHREPNEHFPVSLRDVFDAAGNKIAGYLGVHRGDTDKTLAIHSDSYGLIPNEIAFGATERALAKSGLNLTDMQIATDYGSSGARTFRQYLLPAHTVEVTPGVNVALRLVLMNSYDATHGFKGRCGGYNFVCANTSMIGRDLANLTIRHVGDIAEERVGILATALVEAAETFLQIATDWKRWPNIDVSDNQAIEVFAEVPSASKRLTEHLTHRWIEAVHNDPVQGGRNLWTLYNVLTAWSTHGENGERGSPDTKAQREERVFKAAAAPKFLELKAVRAPQIAEAVAA